MKARRFVLILVLAVALAACLDRGEIDDAAKAVPASSWHSLVVGQTLNVSETAWVMRVPGGWVFHSKGGYGEAACFIPYSAEGAEDDNR